MNYEKMNITKEWLRENNACKSGVKWFLSQDETDAAKIMLKLIECGRPEDFHWIMQKLITTKEQSVMIAVFSAECVIDIFENKHPDDKRPRKAIDAAKEWIKNPCPKTKSDAAYAAYAANAAANAAYAAADAANAAADAANAAAYAAYAAADAADAAYAAVYAADAADAAAYAAAYAVDAAAYAAHKETLKKCADIVRKHYPKVPVVKQ